jgi:glyoxylase-like metal-dependent hydrolase (beta-lactamase superfamily II)
MVSAVALGLAVSVVTPGAQTRGNQGAPARPAWAWRPEIPTVPAGEVQVHHVRGRVYMIVGAGGNVTVQAWTDGIILVDTGTAAMSDKVLAAVRSISRAPIRYIVNTNEREPYSGGNDKLAPLGATVRFRPATDPRVSDGLAKDRASVIAFVSVLERMSAPTGKVAARQEEAWPDDTYSNAQKKLSFNDERVLIIHEPSATDGNSIVHFRTDDVVSVGDLIDLTGFPFIDVSAGGSIQSYLDGLQHLLDITVTDRKSQGGTLVIPGRGRVADQAEVAYYREMLGIIRDRVQDMMKRGLTLAQIKADHPARDYEPRYGRTTGPWTTDMFVEAVYRSLGGK